MTVPLSNGPPPDLAYPAGALVWIWSLCESTGRLFWRPGHVLAPATYNPMARCWQLPVVTSLSLTPMYAELGGIKPRRPADTPGARTPLTLEPRP